MIAIETDRLAVRNFTDADWKDLHRMIVQYEATEYAAYDQQWPVSEVEIKGITEWFSRGDNFLAVCLKGTGQFIGFVALNPEDGADGRQYNLGYIFDSNFHGNGYASEACVTILNRAFGALQAMRVVSGTAAVNRSSCRLLERLGFQKTGQETSSFKNSEDGNPIEFMGNLYALSKEEWERRQTTSTAAETI